MLTKPWRSGVEFAKGLMSLDDLSDMKCSSSGHLQKSENFLYFNFTYVRNHP